MYHFAAIAVGAALVSSAAFGEMISGTNSYLTQERSWKTGEFAGYYVHDSTGTMETQSGPLPDGPVECHGAGFWTAEKITGEGICIFGEAPHQWTVAFTMDSDRTFNAQRSET